MLPSHHLYQTHHTSGTTYQSGRITVPPQYKRFAKVFSEEESQQFPPSCPWDHMIELKKDTPDAIDCKVYPMSQIEDTALKEFLEEHLAKGYICVRRSLLYT